MRINIRFLCVVYGLQVAAVVVNVGVTSELGSGLCFCFKCVPFFFCNECECVRFFFYLNEDVLCL